MSTRFVRGYLLVVLGGLFLQGVGSLLFRLVPRLPASSPLLVRGVFGIDFRHSWIHILWGAAGVGLLVLRRDPATAARLALVFGVFYTALGLLGVSLHHPLGLELGHFENTFHLTAGPLTLLVGGLAILRRPAPIG
ncbi:MAG: hypothetical protein ACM30G_07760 [Micromonosporaceae bacterium]